MVVQVLKDYLHRSNVFVDFVWLIMDEEVLMLLSLLLWDFDLYLEIAVEMERIFVDDDDVVVVLIEMQLHVACHQNNVEVDLV
jgi:hypothetical protein